MSSNSLLEHAPLNSRVINACKLLDKKDAEKLKTDIRNQKEEGKKLHLGREAILGAYLRSKDIYVEYQRKISHKYSPAKTPDWSVFENEAPILIVDVVNHEPSQTIQDAIKNQEGEKNKKVKPEYNKDRLTSKINKKIKKYKGIIEQNDAPFIIAIFGYPMTFLEEWEIEDVVSTSEDTQNLSGIILFGFVTNLYDFKYFKNENCKNKYNIPNGKLNLEN